MTKFFLRFLLILLMPLLSGCWDMININQAAVITGVGIDYRQGKVIYTTQFAQRVSPLEAGSAKQLTVNVITQGSTVSEAARSVTLTSPVSLLAAHAKIIMIGETLARDNLEIVIDFLSRNRNLRPETSIIMAYQDTPEKLLNTPVPLSAYSGIAIDRLLENNESSEGVHVKVTMKDFLSCLITPGVESVLPQVSVSQNNKLFFNGTAVFKDMKMVGSLNEEESRGYRWLNYKTNRGGTLTAYSPVDKKALTFEITNIYSRIRPVLKGDQLQFKIEVKTALNLLEQTGQGNLMTDFRRRQLEELANKEIKKQIKLCLDKAQSLNSDILGLGVHTYRYYPEYWQEVRGDWDRIYPILQTEIKIESQLVGGYLLSNSANLNS